MCSSNREVHAPHAVTVSPHVTSKLTHEIILEASQETGHQETVRTYALTKCI